MTFESFLFSSFIGKFNGKLLNTRARFARVLDAYYGEDHNKHNQFNSCLIGQLYENEAKEVSCAIDEQTMVLPSDSFGHIISCIKSINVEYNMRINTLKKLWEYMNDKEDMGVFFPVCLEDNSIYFLYCQFVRKHLMKNGTLVSYSELLYCCPVLLSIIEQEIIIAINRSAISMSSMAGVVEIIDRVLQRGNFPSIQLIHSLANMKYENRNNEGVISFVDGECETKLRFQKPQPLVYEEIRALRKFFQMTGEGLSLIANHYNPVWTNFSFDPTVNVWMIVGIGDSKDAIGKLFFSGGKGWRFVWKNEEIGYDGDHFFARKLFEREEVLLSELSFICTEEEVKRFAVIVSRLIKQKHGTMLVILSSAREEASRLGKLRRAIEIENYDLSSLTDQEMLMISSIDGCILTDIHGNCTALGAILDGEANIATDIGRGARYNSALTYIMKMKKQNTNAAAIIISEDGSVDFVLTKTIHETISYFDKMQSTENAAFGEIQDARFGWRFAIDLEDDDE